MHPRAWSIVFAGALAAALTLALPAPVADLWSRLTAAIGWGVDPVGSPVPDEERPEPAKDISWGIDPNG